MPSNGTVVTLGNGEIVSSKAAEAVVEMLSPVELVAYVPVTPDQVEEAIVDLSRRLESAVVVIVHLYEEVHRAEEKLELEFSKAVLTSPNPQISFARHYAKSVTTELLHDVNLAKEKLRYAEWLQDALKAKLFGLLNLNKTIAASMFGQGRN